MNVLDWLFDRRRTCADSSLYERQANALRDELEESRAACVVLATGIQELEQVGNDLIAVVSSLTKERDALREQLKGKGPTP